MGYDWDECLICYTMKGVNNPVGSNTWNEHDLPDRICGICLEEIGREGNLPTSRLSSWHDSGTCNYCMEERAFLLYTALCEDCQGKGKVD